MTLFTGLTSPLGKSVHFSHQIPPEPASVPTSLGPPPSPDSLNDIFTSQITTRGVCQDPAECRQFNGLKSQVDIIPTTPPPDASIFP